MAEDLGEIPKIVIASKGGGVRELEIKPRAPEGEFGRSVLDYLEKQIEDRKRDRGKGIVADIRKEWERSLEAKIQGTRNDRLSLFGLIQEPLKTELLENPDEVVEDVLRTVRDTRLVKRAKEIGVFGDPAKDYEGGIKGMLEEAQMQNNFGLARSAIQRINVPHLERESSGLAGWDDDLAGMIGEYRDVAVLNMDLALLRAEEKGDIPEAEKLEGEIRLRGWGNPPLGLDGMASKYVEDIGRQEEEERKKKEVEVSKKEKPATPEGWVKHVFDLLDDAERRGEEDYGELAKNQRADFEAWREIEKSLDEIPPQTGPEAENIVLEETEEYKLTLSNYFQREYSKGIYLKERLKIYVGARRRLHERYLEILRAGGVFVQLGLGKEETPYPGIAVKLENIKPIDWWVLIHGDEMFKEEAGQLPDKEKKEVIFDMDKALSRWWKTGVEYDGDYSKETPISYKEALNSAELVGRLRAAIQKDLGSRKAEELAFRLFTASLTFPLFDRERESHEGKGEDKDLFHFDKKRVYDFGEKEREPGLDWTIGRYWAQPEQAKIIEDIKSEKMRRRKELLDVNSKMSVFTLEEGYDYGELVSDFFHTNTLKENGVERKLVSWAVDGIGRVRDGGWKKIPFYRLGEVSYAGYFGYSVNIALVISNELTKTNKFEDIINPSFWAQRKGTFDRMKRFCPCLNSLEYDFRSDNLREWLALTKLIPDKVNKVADFEDLETRCSDEELRVINQTLEVRTKRDPLAPKNEGKEKTVREWLKERSKKQAEVYWNEQLDYFRMVYALGVLWGGSIDKIRGLTGGFRPSEYPPLASGVGERRILGASDIIRAMEVADFLTSSANLKQLKFEAYRQMGFGYPETAPRECSKPRMVIPRYPQSQ